MCLPCKNDATLLRAGYVPRTARKHRSRCPAPAHADPVGKFVASRTSGAKVTGTLHDGCFRIRFREGRPQP